jgi:hypothetical protein
MTGGTAQIMICASLALNILVLAPVCTGLLLAAKWTVPAFGEPAPARGILLSIYLAIGAMSALLLAVPRMEAAAALLAIQIAYKLTTPFTVGSIRNPVVVSNLLIAAFHAATLAILLR